MRFLFTVLLALSLATAANDQDTQALKNYRLSMSVLHKLASVNKTLAAAQANDPGMRAIANKKIELSKLEQKDSLSESEQLRYETLSDDIARLEESDSSGLNLSDSPSLRDLEVQINAQPALNAALRKAGLSAREYATVMLVIVQTGLAHGLMQSGLLKQAPTDVAPENLKFFRDHENEVAALMDDGKEENEQ